MAYVQWFGSPPEPKTLSPIVQERLLSVADLPGGLVEVRDAETGDLITRYDLGEGAFVPASPERLGFFSPTEPWNCGPSVTPTPWPSRNSCPRTPNPNAP